MNTQKTFRCEVYTRKSHEEGLDQEFNSLDAQWEACGAYKASQIGLGWKLNSSHYDDDGISSVHMEKPALQQLIADNKKGLVDVFDEHNVSFVSITQAFNTTSSMVTDNLRKLRH